MIRTISFILTAWILMSVTAFAQVMPKSSTLLMSQRLQPSQMPTGFVHNEVPLYFKVTTKKAKVRFSIEKMKAELEQMNVQGGADGGGGDSRCEEFYSLATSISSALESLSQEKVRQTTQFVNIELIKNIVHLPFRVLPTENLDRMARSNPETLITKLQVLKWEKIRTRLAKMRLVLHELMILSQVEEDGEYFATNDLMKLLLDQSEAISILVRAESAQRNSNGSVTFIYPRFVTADGGVDNLYSAYDKSGERFAFEGICKSLGYSKYIDGVVESFVPKLNETTAIVDKNGSLVAVDTASRHIYSIICSNQ